MNFLRELNVFSSEVEVDVSEMSVLQNVGNDVDAICSNKKMQQRTDNDRLIEILHSTKTPDDDDKLLLLFGKPDVKTAWKCSFIWLVHQAYAKWASNNYTNNIDAADGEQFRRSKSLDTKKYRCDKCDEIFARKPAFSIHMKKQHGNNDASKDQLSYYKCAICGLQFTSKRLLITHMKTSNHVNVPKYHCNACSKEFISKSTLKNHLSVIHEKCVKFHCKKCNYFAYSTRTLKEHIKVKHAHTNKQYACVICNPLVVFENRSLLKVHLRSHTGEKPYMCSICGSRFVSSGILTNHKRFVHEKRSFRCDVCDKSFSTVHALRRHQLVHQKIRSFVCPFCTNYSSNTSFNITRHVKTVHQIIDFSYYKHKKGLCGEQMQATDISMENGLQFTKQYIEEFSERTGTEMTIDQLKNKDRS